MQRRKLSITVLIAVALLLTLAFAFVIRIPQKSHAASSLRDLAQARGISVGTAVNVGLLNDTNYTNILGSEFNIVVPENALKFDATEPSQNSFDFGGGDAIVNFAQQHNQAVRGHTLVWHNQNPGWVTNGNFSRDQYISILQNHIANVMGHYKGKIAVWDVVNEVIADPGNPADGDGLRTDSIWYSKIGADFINIAFQAAHQADPNAKLYLNDYDSEDLGTKSNAVYNLVKKLKAQGVPIDGVGMQMHLKGPLAASDLSANMKRIADLGLSIQVTEMDVQTHALAGSTDQKLQQEADLYTTVMSTCLSVSACNAFLVWGIDDGHSWLRSFWPDEMPLLFDANYQPKSAYYAVANALSAGGTTTPPPTSPLGITYEAEDATLSGGAKVNTDHAGYSGSGFVDGYWNQGAKTSFSVSASSAGTHTVTLRYGNAMGSTRTLNIYVNGTLAKTTNLASQSSWENWSYQSEDLNLQAGTNTIVYQYDSSNSGNVNLDSIAVSQATKYEAESATLSGGAKANTNLTGYSGSGFVDGYWNQGASTSFSITAASAGTQSVTLHYGNAMGNTRTVNLYVNGSLVKTINLSSQANWNTWADETELLTLKAGTNTVVYQYDSSNSGNVNLDYILVAPITKYEAESATLSGGAKANTNLTGYSGNGFVDGYWNQGASTSFSVSVSSAGTYNVTLHYGNAMGNTRTVNIYVNGSLVKTTNLASLANWNTWADQSEALTLKAGANTIVYQYDSSNSGNVNLDYLLV